MLEDKNKKLERENESLRLLQRAPDYVYDPEAAAAKNAVVGLKAEIAAKSAEVDRLRELNEELTRAARRSPTVPKGAELPTEFEVS